MATIQRFEDFECWKKGRELKKLIYRYTRLRMFALDNSLVDQIRRAAQSVTSNIAEGFEREGNKEFTNFLSISKGSAAEVKDQLYTALDENYITQADFDRAYALANDTSHLIGGLSTYLKKTEHTGIKFKRPPPPPQQRQPQIPPTPNIPPARQRQL